MHPSPDHTPHEGITIVENREDRGIPSNHKEKTTLKDYRMILSGFMQRLAGFFKEIWSSLLMLAIIGAITGGVGRIDRHAPSF
jgi:hypothetical protein